MLFSDFTHTLEKIENISSRNEIIVGLANLFKQLSSSESEKASYILMGNLYPPHKNLNFSIAEKQMISFISEITLDSEAFSQKVKDLGDVGSAYQEESKNNKVLLNLEEAYKTLENIALISGSGAVEKKKKLVQDTLKNLDPISGKFFIRIILGKLRLGFSAMTLLDALSVMITGNKSAKKILENAYNLCADMGKLAKTLKDEGIESIKNITPKYGTPIRPASAERLKTPQDIIDKLGTCAAQPKIDGIRVQVHFECEKQQVFFFSRNMQNLTEMFPEIAEQIKLNIKESFIAEGEVVAFDAQTGKYLAFQETSKRRRKHNIESSTESIPLKLFIFDIMQISSDSLLNSPHTQRRSQLEELLENNKSRYVRVIEEKTVKTAQDIIAYFKEIRAEGHEGLILKKVDGIYKSGKRDFNWIKIKQLEKGGIGDTIDCVVLGYYLGKGRRADFQIGALLVGLFNEENNKFETIAKIGTGIKDHQWIDIKKQVEKFKLNKAPNNVSVHKDLTPDTWVSPNLVVVIEADEISISPNHTAGRTDTEKGFALRFPRLIGFRKDKSPQDTTNIDEIRKLYQQNS